MSELFHPFKGTIINLHTVISSFILISRHDHVLSASEIVSAIEKLKSLKLPDIDQISAELIKAEGRTIRCEIHERIVSIWNVENCLRSGRSR